jgi:hypothetical protein
MLPNQQLEILLTALLDGMQKLFQEKLILNSFLVQCRPDLDWKQLLQSQTDAGTGKQEAALALMHLRKLALGALQGDVIPPELLKPPSIQ